MAIYDNLKQTMQGTGGGRDQAGNTVVGNGIMSPIVQMHGGSLDTVEGRKDLLLAYNIDVYNDIKRFKPERHPILTAMMANAKPADLSRYVVSTSAEDKEFFDNLFDTLRMRNATKGSTPWRGRTGYQHAPGVSTSIKMPMSVTDSNFVGGKLKWTDVAVGSTTADFLINAYSASLANASANVAATASTAMLGTAGGANCIPVSSTKFGGKRVAAFAFAKPSSGIIGSESIAVDHHWSNFVGAGYEATGTITESGTATEVWYGLERSGISGTMSVLLDNLLVVTTHEATADYTTEYQKSACKIAIHQFWRNATWDKFIIVLDLDDKNFDVEWNDATGTADGNWLMMNEVAKDLAIGSTGLTCSGYTYFYNCFVLSATQGEAPHGIPEGSSKQGGNTFKRTFTNKINYTQIFRAPSWSITGTKMAERKTRFIDDWMDTRETNLFLYKDKMTQAFLWGRASEEDVYNNTTGKYERLRHTSGLWDREMNRFKVVRTNLTNYTTSFSSLQASNYLRQFINEVGRSVTAFKGMNTKPTVTVACSMDMIEAIGELEVIGSSNGPNMFGMMAMGQLPAEMKRLGVPTLKYETPKVSLIFMWDPALDFMTKFPLPGYLTGNTAISPRKIMMVADIKGVTIRTLRPDKLQAGIQNIGDDKYEEDMIGEHGTEITDSSLNTIFIVD